MTFFKKIYLAWKGRLGPTVTPSLSFMSVEVIFSTKLSVTLFAFKGFCVSLDVSRQFILLAENFVALIA